MTILSQLKVSGQDMDSTVVCAVWALLARDIFKKFIAKPELNDDDMMDLMQTEVRVDINKFLEAFSIKGESRCIRPLSCTKSEGNSVLIKPNTNTSSIPPDSPFNMDNYSICQQVEALQ